MSVNRYRTAISPNDKYIDIPIEIKFDVLGREQLIEEFQQEAVNVLTNPIKDFDVTKFAHTEYQHTQIVQQQIQTPGGPFLPPIILTIPIPITTQKSSINYEFHFFDGLSAITACTASNWKVDYEAAGFNDNEIYYFANNFKGSFFKLDFYDKPTNENQQIFLSIILPTQQGEKEPGFVGPPQNLKPVEVKKPKYRLDYQGADKEGFYVYWVRDRTLVNLNEFYVSAKFFNAKIGQFIRMINTPQSQFLGANLFNIDKTTYFYYKYILDYDTNEYQVFKENGNSVQRVGQINSPIKWYEFINP
jgi:hypothetical protein